MSKIATAPAAKHRRRPTAARVLGAKGGEQKPYTPYKAPDTALSVATVKLLYALSEGPIIGLVDDRRSVKLNGTPLVSPDGSENFPGTIWDFRPGTVDQEHIPGFPAIENEASQGLPVELKSDNAWTRAITDQQLSAVRIRLSWPQIWQVKTNGDQIGYRIDYAIDLSVDGGSYQTVLSATLDDKGTTEYERTHRIDLPEGFTSALVRVRRLTPNRNDSNFADLMRIKGLTEVIDKKLRYPNLALGGLQFDAKQFQDTPKASFLMRGRIVQVPTNYNPETRTYTGDWNGTFKLAYTNNPVWVWRDLLLHRRYGLGRRITADMVDHWTLYEIGRYCDVMVPDGKGGMQPRMTTNVYIQDSVEGYALLSDLASVFRGSSCWNGSQVTMVADIPGNEDGYVFTRSNIIGEFEYVSAALPDRHTRAKVAWDNPENEFKTQPAPVTNEELIGELGHRMLDISRFGCTVEGEAIRHGIWALKSEQYEEWSVSFTAGMEGRNVELGQIICVADEMFSGRANGGRISAATRRVITLDIDAEVHEEDRLILNLPSGKSEGRIVKSVSGRLVTVMADYSELPEPECSWSVESADLAVMRFRVQTIEPQGLHQFKIAATQHEPLKYQAIDTGARIDPQPTSIIPPGVMSPPENIGIEARSVVSQGIAVTSMRITWDSVPGAIAYNVEWRKDSGNWIRLPRTGNLGADVEGIYSGRYVARVSSVNAMDVASIWGTSSEVVLTGKTGLPPAVSFLTTTSLIYGIGIQWGFPPGAEDTQRTELWYSQSPVLETATKLSDLSYPQASHEMHSLLAGASLFFWARLVDRTGNVGPFFPVTGAVNGRASSDQAEYEKYFADKIGKGALYPSLREEIELISGDGPESVNARLAEAKAELEGLLGQITGAKPFIPDLPYPADSFVQLDGHIYQAIQAVPAGVTPPDANYWKDIGTILETTNALTQQIALVSTKIEEIDGKIIATATSVEALRSAARGDDGSGDLAGALKAWTSTADLAVERKTRATESDAMAQQLITLGAQVGDNKSGLTTLEQVVASNRETAATQVTQLKSGLTAVSGLVDEQDKTIAGLGSAIAGQAEAITGLDTKVTNLDGRVTAQASSNESLRASVRGDDGAGELAGALKAYESTASIAQQMRVEASREVATAERLTTLQAGVDDAKGLIQQEEKIRATAIDVQAKRTDTVQASLGQTNASVQQVSQVVVGLDGKVSAQTTIKAQTIVDGRRVTTGLAFGSDGGQSEFLIFAQRFAVVNEINGEVIPMFVIENNQVVFNTAIISKAFIQEIILGMTLRSEKVDANGLPLIELDMRAGTFAFRGANSAGNSMLLNADGLKMTYSNGVVGIDMRL
ncbi:TipJ family phage tail tip protein [Pseudomonas haemolytica]|uniref:DUF1983 domain-containing protein n=1 Tax=Pseudomonas haemolytica TaxID=2600065 RepID=A0ABS1GQ37_9PSED|nr:DUF1983 domain-containing protein [Pseudomonas haemolytica]MBK3459100.1 DUF1983 domain-containing protein [Pseudomonas haemolytica]